MYCGNCGTNIPYGVSVCPNCGVQAGYGSNYCKNCGEVVTPMAAFCSTCGTALHNTVAATRKSRLIAGLLGIFLGGLGAHNFYLGYKGRGIAQLILTLMSFGIGSAWGMVEGILLLCGSYKQTDSTGLYLDK